MGNQYTSQPASQDQDQVEATIRYVVKGESTIFYPGDREKSYWPGEDHRMQVSNLRSLATLPTVKDNGFTKLHHESRIQDYNDEAEVERVFYPEMVDLAKQVNEANHAIAFGHVARTDQQGAKQHLQPSFAAHVDYGRRTIEEYVVRIMGEEEAAHWLQKRVVLMNFWRPITTVYRSPLALCDASTVLPEDLNPAEVRGGLNDPNRPPLYGWNLSHNPDHRWYYTFEMQPEEIYAFKLYDSDDSRPQWTGHTAIDLPWTDENTTPRQSVEIRTISFIDE